MEKKFGQNNFCIVSSCDIYNALTVKSQGKSKDTMGCQVITIAYL